jgi:hypothetical protein
MLTSEQHRYANEVGLILNLNSEVYQREKTHHQQYARNKALLAFMICGVEQAYIREVVSLNPGKVCMHRSRWGGGNWYACTAGLAWFHHEREGLGSRLCGYSSHDRNIDLLMSFSLKSFKEDIGRVCRCVNSPSC